METIKARVHDATIDKVAQFFDAGSATVLDELFQNARRSGATRVEITKPDESAITITDDGHGIPNPQSLLDFGRSEWNALDHENPAGMGFFALARYRVTIRSQPTGEPTTWYAELGPEHFAGKESATVIRTPRDPDTHDGTTITITHNPKQNFHVEMAALYFPLPVILNGKPVRRESFLANAVNRTTFEGVEIGIFEPIRHFVQNLNFHGVTARSPAVSLVTDPGPNGRGTDWSVAYDVTLNPELQLVLPTRETIVQNHFSERLMKAATNFLLDTVRTLRPNAVVGYQSWVKARSAGFTFPEPEAKLEEWQPAALSKTHIVDRPLPTTLNVGPDSLIFLPDRAGDEIPLYRALKASGTTNVIRSHPEWAGYAWYNAIPKIRSVRILIENAGITKDLTNERKSGKEIEDAGRLDNITFEMTAIDQAGLTNTIRIPGDIAFGEPYEKLIGDLPTVLLTKASKISIKTLEEMIVDGFFQISHDTEDDSSDTQLDRFRAEARYLAISVLESTEEARNDSLIYDIQQLLRHQLLEGERIVIEQTTNALTVDIQPLDAAGENAAGC